MKNLDSSRIKFVDYDGDYPNLCSGVLTVFIDGKEYKFGHHYMNCHRDKNSDSWIYTDEDPNKPNYPRFWESGGCAYFDHEWNSYVDTGPWKYNGDLDAYQNEFSKDIIEDLMNVFNLNVRQGCCGGCL